MIKKRVEMILLFLFLCFIDRASAERSWSPDPPICVGSSLATCVAQIGSTPQTLVISSPISYGSTVTVPSTMILQFSGHGSIDCNSQASAVTINGAVAASDTQQIFVNCPAGSVAGLKYVTPNWFGAKGDGVTDDTTALQAAATAVSATGGRLYLPSGVYLASQWTVKSNTTVSGDGFATELRCQTTEPNFCLFASTQKATNGTNYGAAVSHVTLRDFYLNGQGTTRINAGLGGYVRGLGVAEGSTDVIIEHIFFDDGGSRPLEVRSSSRVRIRNNICEDSSHVASSEGDCLHVEGDCEVGRCSPAWTSTMCRDILIEGNTVSRTGDTAIAVVSCQDVLIAQNKIYGDGYYGASPTTEESGIDASGTGKIHIINNRIENVRRLSIFVQFFAVNGSNFLPSDAKIEGNYILVATSASTQNGAIYAVGDTGTPSNLNFLSIAGNFINNACCASIFLDSRVNNFSIRNNDIYNGNRINQGTTDAGIVISGSGSFPISNGIVEGNFIRGSANTDYGIDQRYTSAANITIRNNTVDTVNTAPVRIASSSVAVKNNSPVTFAQINAGGAIAAPANGSEEYCSDCTVTSGADNTCAGSGTGAKSLRINGVWRCFNAQN